MNVQCTRITTPHGRRCLASMTTGHPDSHYGNPVWTGMARPLVTGERVAVAAPAGQDAADAPEMYPADVLWADPYWALLHIAGWEPSVWFLHLDSGVMVVSEREYDDEPGEWFAALNLSDLVESYTRVSDNDHREAAHLCRVRKARPAGTLADWTGDTVGLLFI